MCVHECDCSHVCLCATVFGKHCECIAQKCTHLERVPPLASHLLLLSHCVLTQHGCQKKEVKCTWQTPGLEHVTLVSSEHAFANCAVSARVLNGSYCVPDKCRLI